MRGSRVQRSIPFFCLAPALALPAAAAAQPRPNAPPEIFVRVTACQAVTEASERLACFDREVAALAAAQTAQQVVIVDQEQIRQTRRGLFGLRLPNIGRMFSHEEGPSEITGKLASVATNGMGRWVFTLDDGSVWQASESRDLAREPRPGMDVRIRQAALGSYMINVAEQRAIRVARIR